jgi:serine/threonine protein kinase
VDFLVGDPINAGANAVAFHISFPPHRTMPPAVIKVCVNRYDRQGAHYSRFLANLFEKDFAVPLRLSHPNIIQVLYHYNGDFTPFHNTIQAHPKFSWLETESMRQQTTFVILPYVPHTLQSFVNEVLEGQPERLSEREWLWIALQLFRAVAYLNTQHIVHRDIKADNVLVHPDRKRVTLIDFGEALAVQDSQGVRRRFVDRVQLAGGAMVATAPEVVAEQTVSRDRSDENLYLQDVYAKNDVWAAGRCVLSVLSDSKARNAFEVSEQAAQWMSAESRAVLRSACQQDSKQRPAASTIVEQLEDLLFSPEPLASDPLHLRLAAACHLLHGLL